MKKEELLLNLISFLLKPLTKEFNEQIKTNENIQKVIALYPKDKFTRIRFWDAPFIEVEKLISKQGNVVDLGCGEGIFTNFLAISSDQRKILGIELAQNRIKKADKGLKNVSFKKGDATKVSINPTDNITLFHLLHHLQTFQDQEQVIKNCISALKKNGKLIIVEVDKKVSFKYVVSWWVDCFLVPWLFEKRLYTPVLYRSQKDWVKLLEKYNLSYETIIAETGKPFTHIIFVCQRA